MTKKIIIKIIVIVLLLIVLFNINTWLNTGTITSNYTSLANSTYSKDDKDIFYLTKLQVEKFMIYISNEKYEDAFNMIDENCRINTFNNNIQNFKRIILEKYFNPQKADRKFTIDFNDKNARYSYNDIYCYYTVSVYSPEISGSDYYNPSNEGKNYNFSESFYKQREIKIDVIDVTPYNFKLIVQFKE